jgi:hypothetical protein
MILTIITRIVKLALLGQIRGRVAGAATWLARTGAHSLVPFAHGLQALAYRPCSKLPVALQSGRIWADHEKKGVEGFKHYSVKLRHSREQCDGGSPHAQKCNECRSCSSTCCCPTSELRRPIDPLSHIHTYMQHSSIAALQLPSPGPPTASPVRA